jgi:hypothetical protein
MPEKASPRLAFLFAAIHGAHPVGPSSLRSYVQNRSWRFFTFCCPAKCPLGQLKLLKITPGDFFIRRHPWRSPFGPSSLRSNVQNRSRRFFVFCWLKILINAT